MKKIIFLITVLLVTNAYGQQATQQAVVELPMNDEVLQVAQEDPVVQQVIAEQAPVQVNQAPVPAVATTKKVVTTQQIVTTQPVVQAAPVKVVQTAPPQPVAPTIQQPMVIQPIVVQPVVLQPRTIEPAKSPAKPVLTKAEVKEIPNVKTQADGDNKNVNIKKNKDGTNVYNFNFYNSKNKAKPVPKAVPKTATPVLTTSAPLPKARRSPTRSGSGPQFEFFIKNHSASGDKALYLDFESGYKASYRIMHQGSGFYIAPGYIKSKIEGAGITGYASNASSGYLVRLGKMANTYRKFYLDYGVEYSRVKGDVSDFYSTMSIDSESISLYLSPSLRWGSFGIAWPLQIGTNRVNGFSQTNDNSYVWDSSNGWVNDNTWSYQDINGSSNFFTLAMSMSFYF